MVGQFLVKQLKTELAAFFFFFYSRVSTCGNGRQDISEHRLQVSIDFSTAAICLGHNEAALKDKPSNARVLYADEVPKWICPVE